MSALGHEHTSRHVRIMSVLPLKADIRWRGLHVRLVPQADILRVDGGDDILSPFTALGTPRNVVFCRHYRKKKKPHW